MLLTDNEVRERIESPLNLLNRLKIATSQRGNIPALPPSSEEIIDNLTEKIGYGSIKSKAISIMSDTLDELKNRIEEVDKPSQLAAIAAAMGKVIEGSKVVNDNSTKVAQVIIYAPQVLSEEVFDVVKVDE